MEWYPLNVTFKNVTCNWDETDPDVVSLIVLVDDNSQKELAAFVDRIEKQMIAHGTFHFHSQINSFILFKHHFITRRMCSSGIPVTFPRKKQEPFHRYPTEENINEKLS
jgi:hypothetical protein